MDSIPQLSGCGYCLGFSGMIGTFLGGYICDRLGKRDDRWYLWLPGLATVLAIPFSVYVYLGDDVIRALFVANIPVMLGAFILARVLLLPSDWLECA